MQKQVARERSKTSQAPLCAVRGCSFPGVVYGVVHGKCVLGLDEYKTSSSLADCVVKS